MHIDRQKLLAYLTEQIDNYAAEVKQRPNDWKAKSKYFELSTLVIKVKAGDFDVKEGDQS